MVCMFYGFGQMFNDMYPSLDHHTENFYCPLKSAVFSLFVHSAPRPLAAAGLFVVSIGLPLPNALEFESHIRQSFRWTSFTYVMHFTVLPTPVLLGFPGGSDGCSVGDLGWEDPWRREAYHSSVLAWRISKDRGAWWAAVHGGCRVRHN